MRTFVLSFLFLASCGSDRGIGSGGTGTPGGGDMSIPPAPRCGDALCNGDETCLTCQDDCGVCPSCKSAPSCTDSAGVPSNPSHRNDLDVGTGVQQDGGMSYAAPDPACKEAQLRLRVSKVLVSKGAGQVYCIVTASDGVNSEAAITTKSKQLNDGDTNYFDPTVGVFWGQKALEKTSTNLTVTYDCFMVGSDAWQKALDALSNASMAAGGIAGPYGWAFGAASAAAAAAAAAAGAASGDQHLLNIQQVIDRNGLLDLTNGRTWELRQNGSYNCPFCKWDWTLTVESWGCADVRTSTN
jgi:hypothetical protein